MLAAAAPSEDRTLETFRLVLVLASQNTQPPESLKAYFRQVLGDAEALLDDPDSRAGTANAEAILLAFRMLDNAELRRLLSAFSSEDFSVESAQQALRSMEIASDAKYQFANFGEEVRATL